MKKEKVSRLGRIINHDISANFFGNLYKKDKKLCEKLLKNYICSLCKNLKELGFNINTIPVLDVLRITLTTLSEIEVFQITKKL